MTPPGSLPSDPNGTQDRAHEEFLRRAAYLSGHPSVAECPPDEGAEIAFAGRSNVGKSSVINALCVRRALARTSSDPGRTRLLHFFEIVPEKRLVDLPGYGFARVSKTERKSWGQMVEGYLRGRRSLVRLILIVDVRHLLKDSDRMLLAWCEEAGLPVHVLLNKSDKLSKSKVRTACNTLRGELACPVDAVSARNAASLAGVRAAVCSYLS